MMRLQKGSKGEQVGSETAISVQPGAMAEEHATQAETVIVGQHAEPIFAGDRPPDGGCRPYIAFVSRLRRRGHGCTASRRQLSEIGRVLNDKKNLRGAPLGFLVVVREQRCDWRIGRTGDVPHPL